MPKRKPPKKSKPTPSAELIDDDHDEHHNAMQLLLFVDMVSYISALLEKPVAEHSDERLAFGWRGPDEVTHVVRVAVDDGRVAVKVFYCNEQLTTDWKRKLLAVIGHAMRRGCELHVHDHTPERSADVHDITTAN